MWYVNLLEYLAIKICPNDAAEAALFIKSWIRLLKKEFYHTDEIEPSVIIGLATDLYKISNENQGQGKTLAQFAQKCVGLSILHVKNAEDDSVYSSDFAYILSSKNVLASLDVDRQLLSLRRQYLLGTKKNKKVKPLSSLTDVNMYIDNREQLNEVILVDILNACERKVFKEINYHVKADVSLFVPVLNEFLNKTENSQRMLIKLYLYFLPYRDESESISQLLDAIRRNSIIIESSALVNKGHHVTESNKFHVPQRRKTSSINLTLIPRLVTEELPHHNAKILRLCLALDIYSEKVPENSNSFYSRNFRRYKLEVARVVRTILEGNLLSVAAVIRELKKIDILGPDELSNLIKKYDEADAEQTIKPKLKM